MTRKDPLETGEAYHIFSKSIAGFVIFNNEHEFKRMLETVLYYQNKDLPINFSKFARFNDLAEIIAAFNKSEKLVQIIAYSLMPTHFHFILKQLTKNGISIFMRKVLDSYTRYFNIKHNRKGPLWEGKFKSVLMENDEQLLHLTRYIHLNPVTSGLCKKPEQWQFSSYNEYLSPDCESVFCKYDGILEIKPKSYKKFVEDRIDYQRELKRIKDLMLD